MPPPALTTEAITLSHFPLPRHCEPEQPLSPVRCFSSGILSQPQAKHTALACKVLLAFLLSPFLYKPPLPWSFETEYHLAQAALELTV